MNTGVLILFINAIFATVLSAGIVIWILRKQYLPVIKRLEKGETLESIETGETQKRKGS
ncbi:Uncharacterised protein [Bacillus freudenreichii]|nr:Uncharacterised protein [Bacillus freudenreichii]